MICMWMVECEELEYMCEECWLDEYVHRYDREEYEIEYEEYIRGFYDE